MTTKIIEGGFIAPTAFLPERGIRAAGFEIIARRENRYVVTMANLTFELVVEWNELDIIEFTLIANNQPVNEGLMYVLARQLITPHSDGLIWDKVELFEVSKGEFIEPNKLTYQLSQQNIPVY